MAIKGKRKPKQRPASRPPKREPVAPPTPFLHRRSVQLTAGFLVGVFAMIVFVWVTNSLRADDAEAESAADAAKRRAAATAYQQAVRGAFGEVGVVDPGIAPTIFVEMDTALDAMAAGNQPPDAEATFEQAAADAAKARKELAGFDVTGTVADQGFDAIAAGSFTGSAETLVQVLDRYRQAADVAAAAAVAGASPSCCRSITFSEGRVTNGAITAGRRASAADTRVQISWGSQGVSVIIVPSGKLPWSSCRAWGSACVGPSSPVLTPACAHTRMKGL